eukprot:COSAG02_NODE_1279_length_13487_cov_7.611696_8_plen_63_part_00
MVMELVEGPNGKNNLRQVIDDKSIRPNFSISLRARMLQDISQGCAQTVTPLQYTFEIDLPIV